MAITTLQQLGLVCSAIQRSSECVIYATLDFQETAFTTNYWVTLPDTRALHHLPWPGNCTWQSLSSTGGGVVVGWALRNSGGGVWPSVMKRYEGVGGCQIYGQKALRNTWMAPDSIDASFSVYKLLWLHVL